MTNFTEVSYRENTPTFSFTSDLSESLSLYPVFNYNLMVHNGKLLTGVQI